MRATNDRLFIFVIDTDQYAGNFERPMCAYMTGRIGECNIGKKEAEQFTQEYDEDIFEYVVDVPDDDGCLRPCSIYPTEGLFNNGVGGHFKEGQEKEALEDFKKYCLREAQRIAYPNHPKSQEKHRLEWEEERANGKLKKHPAYLSVAIFMGQKPTQKEIEILMVRAKEFANKNNINITGFRLVQEETKVNLLQRFE